jgi:hypothetical protein
MKKSLLLKVRRSLVALIIFASTLVAPEAFAKTNRKVQEVNFDETDVSGSVRRPEGLYMVQKRNIDFMPLYKVREQFDRNIKDSVEYMR